MNQLWDGAVDALLRGDLDVLDDPLVIAPYARFNYRPEDTTTADLPIAAAAPAVPLANRDVSSRTLYADDVIFPSVSSTVVVERLVISRSSDALLVVFIDTRPDRMPLYVAANGAAIEIIWNERAVMTL